MKKLILLTIFALGVIFTSNAQFKVGANLNLSIPTGDMGDVFSTGFGGTITGLYQFNENVCAGLQTGIIHFGEKDNRDVTFSIVPVTAVGKIYLSKATFKPYFGADLGLYSVKAKSSQSYYGTNVTISASETHFGIAPSVGFESPLSDKLLLDVNAKFTNIFGDSSINYFGINAGVIYKF